MTKAQLRRETDSLRKCGYKKISVYNHPTDERFVLKVDDYLFFYRYDKKMRRHCFDGSRFLGVSHG